MTARRVRRRRTVKLDLDALIALDPAFAATDATLLAVGYDRVKTSALYLTRSGQISGRVVWRKNGSSLVWASTPCNG